MNSTDQKTHEAWQECCRAKEERCPDARPNPKKSLSVKEVKELVQEKNKKLLESLKEVIKESAKGTKTIGVEEYEELLKKANALSYIKDGETVEVTKDEAISLLDQVKNTCLSCLGNPRFSS